MLGSGQSSANAEIIPIGWRFPGGYGTAVPFRLCSGGKNYGRTPADVNDREVRFGRAFGTYASGRAKPTEAGE
jgi:hypothetical protein